MTGPALDHRYVEGAQAEPVLLLLHGTGGTPDDILALGKELSPSSTMIAPAGPVSENGAARWFRRLAEGVFDVEDVIVRAGELAEFIEVARDRYDLAGRRLVAAGFSNGANIAAAVALLRPDVLDEVVLFSAMSPLPEPPAADLHGGRVFLANGRQDPMAPLDSSERLVRTFRDRGAEVTEYWHPGGHQITADGLESARQWLAT
ncbi:phospholipase/carboxylesterase [Prauserella sediminis]|uniref:Phospholipase/carboxylesterase n=1 Tax=Prauserella sediminis TaxID=577680 RepID=A0A839XNB4_9PSEU|nr:alpha/beta hydrolase [Prauserella sediminis]MBB3663379.1 phospholipase/carboxylesterase [Prauserella sediminis]